MVVKTLDSLLVLIRGWHTGNVVRIALSDAIVFVFPGPDCTRGHSLPNCTHPGRPHSPSQEQNSALCCICVAQRVISNDFVMTIFCHSFAMLLCYSFGVIDLCVCECYTRWPHTNLNLNFFGGKLQCSILQRYSNPIGIIGLFL